MGCISSIPRPKHIIQENESFASPANNVSVLKTERKKEIRSLTALEKRSMPLFVVREEGAHLEESAPPSRSYSFSFSYSNKTQQLTQILENN